MEHAGKYLQDPTSFRSALVVTTVLKLSNLNDTLILKTDASSLGVSAVCLQYEDSMKKPFAHASILTKAQVNYYI